MVGTEARWTPSPRGLAQTILRASSACSSELRTRRISLCSTSESARGWGGPHSFRRWWRRAHPVPAVVTGLALADRGTGRSDPDRRCQFTDGLFDHLVSPRLFVVHAVGGELFQQRREFPLDLDDLPRFVEFSLETLGTFPQPGDLAVPGVCALTTAGPGEGLLGAPGRVVCATR